jgi:endonuclease/exonuclease/phosphatase family metal-dependent hydrolase
MRLRLATFNLESLDDRPDLTPNLAARIAILRPQLLRLDADILCLQEVNGQETGKHAPRRLLALDALLADTQYAAYHRAATLTKDGHAADVHNLVTLSRFAFAETRQIRHDYVTPPLYRPVTAIPPAPAAVAIEWDRPILYTAATVPGAKRLHVLNLHLRAPLASFVAGQKLAPFVWKTSSGWAEGFYIAAMKRTGQALEARLFVDRLFDAEPEALVAAAGDFNAEARETPVQALRADAEETGNEVLAMRALQPLERDVAQEQRYSVLHHGQYLMLDHLLVSPLLQKQRRKTEIHNEALADEYEAYTSGRPAPESFHAPVVAEFDLP